MNGGKTIRNTLLALSCLALSAGCQPSVAVAAGFQAGVQMLRQEGGAWCWEFWYNGAPVWKVILSADGARPVSAGDRPAATWIIPTLHDGMFTVRIQ